MYQKNPKNNTTINCLRRHRQERKAQKIKGIFVDAVMILTQSNAKSLITRNLYSEYLLSISGVVNMVIFLAIYHYILDFRETAIRNEKQLFSEHVTYFGLVNAKRMSTTRCMLLLA